VVDNERLTKIKRAILWVRRNFEIKERTDVPEFVENIVRPTIDVLGWERLLTTSSAAFSAATPNSFVQTGTFANENTIRLFLKASVFHSDTGVTHEVRLERFGEVRGSIGVALPLDQHSIGVGPRCAMIGNTFILPGQFLRGRVLIALVAGTINLNVQFIDIPNDEYIPPFPS